MGSFGKVFHKLIDISNKSCLFDKNFSFSQIVGPSGVCYASECSEVDPKTREMKLQTRNVRIFLCLFTNIKLN